MKKIDVKRTSVLALVAVLLAGAAMHLWIARYDELVRLVFPGQALFAKASVQCEAASPEWLREIALEGIGTLKALSTQVAYISRHGEHYGCQAGWRDGTFLSGRVSKDTRFRYGSMTKPVTAAALLGALGEKRLSLDSRLKDFFIDEADWHNPEFLLLGDVSVGQLLRHTAGLVDRGVMFDRQKQPWCPYHMGELATLSVNKGSIGRTKYSNLGYCLLGEIYARLRGVPYREAIEHDFYLSSRGIRFAEPDYLADEVRYDYRYNDFYAELDDATFDFEAISSTAGMSGSAGAYAALVHDLLSAPFAEQWLGGRDESCDDTKLRHCYGAAFYAYQSGSGERLLVKEGYMPGSSAVVVLDESRNVLVWVGNSDTDNAAAGGGMRRFLDFVSERMQVNGNG